MIVITVNLIRKYTIENLPETQKFEYYVNKYILRTYT